MDEQITITITEKDLIHKKDKTLFTDSGDLIDELAYSADQYTRDELYNDCMEYDRESFPYIIERFGFEKELLDHTKTNVDILSLITLMAKEELAEFTPNKGFIPYNKKSRLQAGAFYAIKQPEEYALLLEAYKEACDEAKNNYWDSTFLDKFAPNLVNELQESVDEYHKEQEKEWLNGDHHGNYMGVIKHVGECYGTEDQDYDDKNFTFTFDKSTIHEKYCGCEENMEENPIKYTLLHHKLEKKDYKQALLESIFSNCSAREYKEKMDREHRIQERKEKEEREKTRLAEKQKEKKAKEQARIKALKKRKIPTKNK